MVGPTCCDLCNRPLRFGMMSIQNYIINLHTLVHTLENFRKNFNHFERRLAMANAQTENKVLSDMDVLSEQYRQTLFQYGELIQSPYYVKVESFYPDLFKVLSQVSKKVMNSREAKIVQNSASDVI